MAMDFDDIAFSVCGWTDDYLWFGYPPVYSHADGSNIQI